ncbi:MAG: ATP phosphoribosyltransferase regulatory subunit [Pseudomonadota bacterium]
MAAPLGMKNTRDDQIRTTAAGLTQAFQDAGALPVETETLLPADVLLDLYGEDIRARAFTTYDPAQGERMLRPDFTVPVVQRHMAEGAEPARYTYSGLVWRKRTGASEYTQVGYELFDRENPAAADAEVFALFHGLLAPQGLVAATGDMGLVRAAVDGLRTLPARRAALLRHLWRPARFLALLHRYGGRADPPPSRTHLLVEVGVKGIDAVIEEAGPSIGLRGADDIRARIDTLRAEATEPPISVEEVAMVEAVIALKGTTAEALAQVRALAADFPGLRAAGERIEARMAALDAAGVPAASLPFEASFGRTTLEYYDGFVFGFFAEARPDIPIVASGGRYDALTRVLGQGRSIAAVGGVIRPEALLEATQWS